MKTILKMAAYVVALSVILNAYLFDQRLYVLIAFVGTYILLFYILPELYKLLFPSVDCTSWIRKIKESISDNIIKPLFQSQKTCLERN